MAQILGVYMDPHASAIEHLYLDPSPPKKESMDIPWTPRTPVRSFRAAVRSPWSSRLAARGASQGPSAGTSEPERAK